MYFCGISFTPKRLEICMHSLAPGFLLGTLTDGVCFSSLADAAVGAEVNAAAAGVVGGVTAGCALASPDEAFICGTVAGATGLTVSVCCFGGGVSDCGFGLSLGVPSFASDLAGSTTGTAAFDCSFTTAIAIGTSFGVGLGGGSGAGIGARTGAGLSTVGVSKTGSSTEISSLFSGRFSVSISGSSGSGSAPGSKSIAYLTVFKCCSPSSISSWNALRFKVRPLRLCFTCLVSEPVSEEISSLSDSLFD
jgi:hypothetical protein